MRHAPRPCTASAAGCGRSCAWCRWAVGAALGCSWRRLRWTAALLRLRRLSVGRAPAPPPARFPDLPPCCAPLPCRPQLQLKEAAYKRPTVAALRAVAAEVEGALGEAGAKLQQARGGGAGGGFGAGGRAQARQRRSARLGAFCGVAPRAFPPRFSTHTALPPERDMPQASLQLRQYRALGPGFAEQAAEHRALLGALEETEYELREVEQFRQLAAATR